jgi:hypothetical protein
MAWAVGFGVTPYFGWLGIDVTPYFSFGGNERNSLFYVVGN